MTPLLFPVFSLFGPHIKWLHVLAHSKKSILHDGVADRFGALYQGGRRRDAEAVSLSLKLCWDGVAVLLTWLFLRYPEALADKSFDNTGCKNIDLEFDLTESRC